MALCDNDLIMAGAVTTVVSRPGDVFSLQFDTYNTMPHTMPHTKPHTMPYTMPHADTDTHTDTDIICHNNVTTTLNFATPYTIIHECNDITMLKQNYTIIHASPMLLHNLNTKCFNNMLLLPNKAQPL